MASSTPLLYGQQLGRRAVDGQAWLFRQLDIKLLAGSFLWVQGPSGCGKSTLLRCLAKLIRLDEGRIEVGPGASPSGLASGDIASYRARFLLVPQQTELAGKQVAACLAEPFAWRCHAGRTFALAEARRWCERLGFGPELLDKEPAHLSGGERQVVAMIRALLLEPQGLLLDEPDHALDQQRKALLWEQLGAWVQDKRRFIVCVSHDAHPPLSKLQVQSLNFAGAAS